MEEVGGAVPDEAGGGAGAIPIISVTQHSPAASKAFFILGLIFNLLLHSVFYGIGFRKSIIGIDFSYVLHRG